MGQTSSTNAAKDAQGATPVRPTFASRSSSSSTTTVRGASSPSSAASSASTSSAKRRKSIELPDLDPRLAFTASPPGSAAQLPDSPSRWPSKRTSALSGRKAPPSASKSGATVSLASIQASPLPPVSPSLSLAPALPSKLPRIETNAVDGSESSKTPLEAVQGGPSTASLSTSESVPSSLDHAGDVSGGSEAVTIPPPNALSPTSPTEVETRNALAMLIPSPIGINATSPISALEPPNQTIIAPLLPESIGPLPLGAGATPNTALIRGAPVSATLPGTLSSPTSPSPGAQSQSPPPANAQFPVVAAAEAANVALPVALPASAFPLPAEQPETVIADAPRLPAAAPLAPISVMTAGVPDSETTAAADAVKAAIVDPMNAGDAAVPTLITWRPGEGEGGEGGHPTQVFVTGTFANNWATKIEMRPQGTTQPSGEGTAGESDNLGFSALVALPPGPTQLKFIVDKQWTTSRHLPSATDRDGNLVRLSCSCHADHQVNYLQVARVPTQAFEQQHQLSEEEPAAQVFVSDEPEWTDDIPAECAREDYEDSPSPRVGPPPPVPQSLASPPHLPASLSKGVLNDSNIVAQGSGDDNSILPIPDHTAIDHLAASPITKGLLSVGMTKRYRRKFVTVVYYKPITTGAHPTPAAA